MNSFDNSYHFRIAAKADAERLREFIRRNWQVDHIFVKSDDFFEYEFSNIHNPEKLNFVICECKSTKSIRGIHGFIPYTHNHIRHHVCGVITAIEKENSLPLLGIELIRRFIQLTAYSTYCGIGTNPKTMVPIASRVFKRHVGKMDHFFILNPLINKYRIASLAGCGDEDFKRLRDGLSAIESGKKNVDLVQIQNIEELTANFDFSRQYDNLPAKESWYFNKRYFSHPIYKYRVYGVLMNGTIDAIIVAREAKANGSQVLRLVDFLGDTSKIAHIGHAILGIIENEKFEYVDFLLHGVESSTLEQAGFIRKKEADPIIVPNYFEPFERRNVEVWFEKSEERMALFRADADGDRPSLMAHPDEVGGG